MSVNIYNPTTKTLTEVASGSSTTFDYPFLVNPPRNKNRWLRFSPSSHTSLVIQKDVVINLSYFNGYSGFKKFEADTAFNLGTLVAGANYYVKLNYNGTNFSLSTVAIPDDTSSIDYTYIIGRFSTLCVDVGTITDMKVQASTNSGLAAGNKILVKPYKQNEDPDFYSLYNVTVTNKSALDNYDLISCNHPLSGYKAGEILPESVWCTTFKPSAKYDDAMVYDKDSGKAIDIYLMSGMGQSTRSKYGARHTVSRTYKNMDADATCVGKMPLSDDEFTMAALGSNEKSSISGGDQTTVGGHKDTAGRRMISAIGCEEMCGYLWQILREIAPTGTTEWKKDADSNAEFGQEYGMPYVYIAGGYWYDSSSSCGSRSRNSSHPRSRAHGVYGCRCSCRVVTER